MSDTIPSTIKVNLTTLARTIDHSLLHPTMSDQELQDGLLLAMKYGAAVCIKPYAVSDAVKISQKNASIGKIWKLSTVVGFPHGSSSLKVKELETFEAAKQGAEEIDLVVNIGKVLSEDWEYVKNEVSSIQQVASHGDAMVKVIFENDFLEEKHIRKLCEICKDAKVAFAKTSTGYGFRKDSSGKYYYKGATEKDLLVMRECLAGSEVQIKAAGGVRTLDDLLRCMAIGVSRIGATATKDILEEAMRRGIGEDDVEVDVSSYVLGGGNY